MTDAARPTILIAGGGTGGHVFPGLAVADALRAASDVRVVFFGTPRGLEARVIPGRGYELELLDVLPLKGVSAARAARGVLVAAREVARAVARVRRLRPAAVLSVGGYAAGPVSLAAALLRVPVAILEPNRIPGLAHRLLAPVAREAYVAWDETGAALRGPRVMVCGVPLRAGFRPDDAAGRRTARVLVMGGSQGAGALNERVPQALGLVARGGGGDGRHGDGRGRPVPELEIVHQTGPGADAGDETKLMAVMAAYEREGLRGVRVLPFLDDVAARMAWADVIVARAGAVTVAEIAAVGRASVLVPYPHAADDHQARNAAALAGLPGGAGAVCVRQEAADVPRLAREIGALLADPDARDRMAARARAHGKPDAAAAIARALLALASMPSRASETDATSAVDATTTTTTKTRRATTPPHEVP